MEPEVTPEVVETEVVVEETTPAVETTEEVAEVAAE
jgi:hypothetical protein